EGPHGGTDDLWIVKVGRFRGSDDLRDPIPIGRAYNGAEVARVADIVQRQCVFVRADGEWAVRFHAGYGQRRAITLKVAQPLQRFLRDFVNFTFGRPFELTEE